MWWVRTWLALKARYRQYKTLLQGLTPQIFQTFNQDGSVAGPASCSLLRNVLVPYMQYILNY